MKIYKIMMFIAFIFILLQSCNKSPVQPLNPPIISSTPELVWKYKFSEEYASSIDPVVYNDKIIVSDDKFSSSKINFYCIDTTGKLLWVWNDHIDGSRYNKVLNFTYQNIFLPVSTKNEVNAIDLNTGKTVWKKENVENMYGAILGNKIIQGLRSLTDYKLYYGYFNIDNYKDNIELYSNSYKNFQIRYGFCDWLTYNNDTLIFYPLNYSDSDFKNFASRAICYNLSKNKLEYDTLMSTFMINDGYSYYSYKTYQNNLYTIGANKISCFIPFGKMQLKWETNLTASKGFSFMIAADNKIFVQDDNETYVWALDANTGAILWKTPASGNCLKMNYYKGQIIYASGGDGYVHCLDANTGKYKWKLVSPDFKYDSGLFFDRGCTIDENSGKMYVTNFKYLLCYQLP